MRGACEKQADQYKYQNKTQLLFIIKEGVLITFYSSRLTNTRYSQASSFMGSSDMI